MQFLDGFRAVLELCYNRAMIVERRPLGGRLGESPLDCIEGSEFVFLYSGEGMV